MRIPLFLTALVAALGLSGVSLPLCAEVPYTVVVPEDAAGPSDKRPLVRFGLLKPMKAYGENNYQPGEADIRKPLIRYLTRSIPQYRFQFVEYELPDLGEAVRRHEVDFALMSAGQYVETRDSGAYALATVYTARFPDPNRFTGALFVTTADHPEIRTIADMKGRPAAFNSKANFINYQIPLARIASEGFDLEGFFSQEYFTADRPPEVLRLLLSGRAAVGAFRVCELETLMRERPELIDRFVPIALKGEPGEACLRSTELYPGWTVALTSAVDPALTKRIQQKLLAMPVDKKSGMGWSVATEFSRVNDVLRTVKVGPYGHLREWTIRRIWEKYSGVIVAALLLLAGWIVHWLSVERLAQSRARELNDAFVRQREVEDRALRTEERLSAMSRLGVVSQLSSIFAHELGQPLSAIRYRVRAVQRMLGKVDPDTDRVDECLSVIDEQSEKAARILDRVRSYAKGQTDRTSVIRLDLMLENVLSQVKSRIPFKGKLHVLTERTEVTGDELEMSLALMNILKNAFEAATDEAGAATRTEPRINVQLTVSGERVRLMVENSGRVLTDEMLAEHMTPLSSRKQGGTGLGIMIVSSIAEAHGGTFSLTPAEKGGARAVLDLPLLVKRKAVQGKSDNKEKTGEGK